MRVIINGEAHECAEDASLSSLVEQLGMRGDRLAIELNREIVTRAHWPETVLQEGDRLEIVHFVGGGSSAAVC